MSALYWQDLDCTAESRALCHGVVHEHYASDREACAAFVRAVTDRSPDRPLYRCIHGPGGLVHGVVGLWLGTLRHDESVPLEHRPPAYAECQGADDPLCGRCRLSVHGCNGAMPRSAYSEAA